MRRRRVAVALVLIGAAVCGWLYYSYDPATHAYPRCAFHMLTGFDCPGCGSQRALHALLQGRVGDAWALNAGLIVGLVMVPAYACAEWWSARFRRLHRWLTSPVAAYALAAAIAGWWIFRNL